MSKFIRAGRCWINLELVTVITFVESHKQPDEVIAARVQYSSGKHDDFKDPEIVRALREFLDQHQAT